MAQIRICNSHSFNIGEVTVEFSVLLPNKRDIILGIRPEKLVIVPPNTPFAIPGKIEHIEYLGCESVCHVEITKNITWYVKSDDVGRIKIGDQVGLQFSSEDIHWFDPLMGIRIL
ncbi:MAG: TOBE domain-containing protein [Candidatus Brocadiaceae bacterium]|nr:TOBE domain-containing protein [Candidatus Brocadiaceae bacterium]